MKITDVTDITDFHSVQDHGRLTAVSISKHSLFRLKITVGCRLCWCCVDMCGVRVVCVRVC